ncbi:molybdate ABC transporter substrate-binding protein [Aurantiacibacter aquimixticola]|uniref:Molybdate ABC transporter substrate-binding protein n=1 Tax=Aurantiacibacter aquimixticola TaxID=1958945 RepID=A0A419RTU3_9SPHN|nr:molybdate ABC transporter substrate-binding protein [Aurantiacibacter aquimixticola]RJY09205.1 molybdate ABC transporter substrate-binding protein [Aurantiacibacter aquimixticola]
MRGRLLRVIACLLSALVLSACDADRAEGPVVLAPSSMQNALKDIADAWQRTGRPDPILSFAGTPSLVRQVDEGAPADLIITADREWMSWLEERSLIDPAPHRVIAGNRLALIAPRQDDPSLSIADRLTRTDDWRLAMADPESVPAGRYARAALERMGLWSVMGERIIPTENVRAALMLVEAGEAEFGIVYATDAQASRSVAELAIFDVRDTPQIEYPAARLAGATHPDAADFLAFLHSMEAMDIFARHGFTPYEQPS